MIPQNNAAASPPCLSCRDLHVSFYQDEGVGRAVRGVSFDVGASKTLGIVGESGCGKSVTALSLLRLVPAPPGKIDSGSVLFDGRDLLKLSDTELRAVRGGRIAMIFQDPMTSLNPVFTCGYQIREAIEQHRDMPRREADNLVLDMLAKVGIREPGRAAKSYPHEMSGGMLQRVMIAMALSCSPTLLVADEPTTALDVTVQARILDLLLALQQSLSMSMILITHDLGIVCDVAHEVVVMYAGQVVEHASVAELFSEPLHPYTVALFGTIPYLDKKQQRLSVIPGEVPDPLHVPAGCPFHPRCSRRFDRCERDIPPLFGRGDREVRCFLYA
jgi:oligopeptide/dipeptide ABC transporter ATP-binding protein